MSHRIISSDGPVCDAKNCGLSATTVPGLNLFRFPDPATQERGVLLIWRIIAQLDEGSMGRWLCERHFKRLELTGQGDKLVPRAVPSYPTGELNPRTLNYCPEGKEHLDGGGNNKPEFQSRPPSDGITRVVKYRKATTNKRRTACLVVDCDNNEDSEGIKLFSLPLQDNELLKKWMDVIPLKQWHPNEMQRLCSAHFTSDSFKCLDDGTVVLQNYAVPTVFPPASAASIRKRNIGNSPLASVALPPSTNSFNSAEQISSLVFNKKYDLSNAIKGKWSLVKHLSKVISKFEESIIEKDVNSVVRYLNRKDKGGSSLFLDLFVAKKCPLSRLDSKLLMRNRKRPRIETKSKVVEMGSFLEVTIPRKVPILEQMPEEVQLPEALSHRDLIRAPVDCLEDELNVMTRQVDVLCSGLLEKVENWFREEECKNPYVQFCRDGIKAAIQTEKDSRTSEMLDKIAESSLMLMFFCPEVYYALETILPPLTSVLRGKSEFGCSPGFTNKSFEELKANVDRSDVCLSFLEQAIELEVLWDGAKLRGYCDYGFDTPTMDNTPKASKVLIFFATCLKTDFKVPLGYHFVNQVSASVIANITKCYLIKLSQNDIRCCAFTCEPEAKSLEVLQCLGFNYDFLRDKSVDSSWFVHPANSEKIYCFFDSFRLAQQAGFLLVERGELIVNSSRQTASWTYINDLEEVIESTVGKNTKISRINKLCGEWDKLTEKLNTPRSFFLSKARSEALSFCSQTSVRRVASCRGTIDFIDKINEFYDICCSSADGDGRALSKSTKVQIHGTIKNLAVYFWNIWVNNGMAKAGRKMPVSGFLLNLSNLSKLVSDYSDFLDDETKELFTSRLNMVALDEFLGKSKVGGQYLSSSFAFQKNYEICVKTLLNVTLT